ncbi:PspC domain-containing protein [Virgibacillus salarius]
MKKLYRSNTKRLVAGVFGGLSDYFNIDATILRLVFVVCLIFSLFSFAFVYLAAALIIPTERENY